MNHLSTKCGCGSVFQRATVKSRETTCVECQRRAMPRLAEVQFEEKVASARSKAADAYWEALGVYECVTWKAIPGPNGVVKLERR